MRTHGVVLADELEAKLREIEATLGQASDAQWRAVCPSEGWPVGLVAFHLAFHMERPAGWLEDALAGKPPFEFSSAETDALNAAVAGYGILPSKGLVLGALAGAWSRMRAALHALTDADLERVALIDRTGGAGEAKVATVRSMMRVVMRRTDDHFASIRAAVASAA
jgi:DinB family protein